MYEANPKAKSFPSTMIARHPAAGTIHTSVPGINGSPPDLNAVAAFFTACRKVTAHSCWLHAVVAVASISLQAEAATALLAEAPAANSAVAGANAALLMAGTEVEQASHAGNERAHACAQRLPAVTSQLPGMVMMHTAAATASMAGSPMRITYRTGMKGVESCNRFDVRLPTVRMTLVLRQVSGWHNSRCNCGHECVQGHIVICSVKIAFELNCWW